MKITNGKLDGSIEALNTLIAMDLPIIAAFKLAMVVEELNPITKRLSLARNKIIEKFGTRGDDGEFIKNDKGGIHIPDEEGFNAEMGELMNIENEMKAQPIQQSELRDITIATKTLLPLMWLFEMKAEEAPEGEK